ncbi:enterobactin transporter EntS [Microbulbifer thermotolerans]|uniref:Multidrug efflux pump Tap n=1 Tax=Microbulbifer thermotolerans TaxID=252514 RepID=A0AB35I0D0_MICTH|nr:enterobactin transporter EntS [Microbulbifer thermotolerans]MCX2802549.1 enterobactin transporter EntS [Microbulbifer thermotolerans]MCX2842979.1 enterobactin transporter EntS [Microbulbifer thermotolerans]
MSKKSLFVDFSILKSNRHFRHVFIARTISLLGLGILSVAIPLQTYELTGDSFHVGSVMAVEGAGLFVGLLWGGVLADRYDRKKLILFARTICGVGFLGMAINAWLPQPSLAVVYGLALWDGFFGALGVTALLAAMPFIVGREHLIQARAVSMVSMRLASVISPALGGVIIAFGNLGWSYMLAALGTGLTLIPLLGLPTMKPDTAQDGGQKPLWALAEGFAFVFSNPLILGVVGVGILVTLATGVRVLFPALNASQFGGGAFELGLLYSAVPVGAALGALLSGWASHLRQPGLVMAAVSLGAFTCLMLFSLSNALPIALFILAVFGYLVAIAGLLEYGLVQDSTPDHYLGRVNAIWTAQDACGDSVGTLGAGLLGKWLSATGAVFAVGAGSFAAGLLLLLGCRSLRDVSGRRQGEEAAVEKEGAEGDCAST